MTDVKKIEGRSKTIREILGNAKYAIDYYQREYKWQQEHVATLLSDLDGKFWDSYEVYKDKGREHVLSYPHYFLGSYVLSLKGSKKAIIDGQQRLTSITLLLIYLRNLANEAKASITNIDSLIFSEQVGKLSFNIDVPERADCLERLFKGKEPNQEDNHQSVQNIYERYADIVDLFPDRLKGDVLPFFVDWFIECVDLVEIMTYSDDDAYTVFETMNDRGLRLSASDMLKGYLLSNIEDDTKRDRANDQWKEYSRLLTEQNKGEDDEFLKKWLRAKFAQSIRERKKGSSNEDYEKIGTAFHKWVREEREKLGLARSEDYYDFITNKMTYFVSLYLQLWQMERTFNPDFAIVSYNSYHYFTQQDTLILSAVKLHDKEDEVRKKMLLISRFVEMYIVLRSLNYKSLGSSAIQYTMFLLTKEVRDKSAEELAALLKGKIKEMMEEDKLTFAGIKNFSLGYSKKFAKFLLARITQYIEQKSGIGSSVAQYLSDDPKPFEIEHILADKYERYKAEYATPEEFAEWRNSIGALVLLPRGYNQSFSDDPYEVKVKHYLSQNLLARSLHPQCYEKNPSFRHYIEESKLPFESYETFGKEQIEERCKLIQSICEEIWDVREFDKIVSPA